MPLATVCRLLIPDQAPRCARRPPATRSGVRRSLARGPSGFEASVPDVGHAATVDPDVVTCHPHIRVWVLLGVDGEDAQRADGQVVDVSVSLTNRDRVQDTPLGPKRASRAATASSPSVPMRQARCFVRRRRCRRCPAASTSMEPGTVAADESTGTSRRRQSATTRRIQPDAHAPQGLLTGPQAYPAQPVPSGAVT